MVVTAVQDYIAAGQVRSTEQLIDVQQVARPGTLTVLLEPLYKGGLDDVTDDPLISFELISLFESVGAQIRAVCGLAEFERDSHPRARQIRRALT
jgi:hypothetical protein